MKLSDPGREWYVVQAKPRRESEVLTRLRLRAAGIDGFLPRIEVVRSHAGRRYHSLEPLFPSYLFFNARLTPAAWNAVRWTPGVRRILGDGERPIAVPDDFIETIRQRMEPLGFIRPGSNLACGARVRVKDGPFAGLEGIFERPTSRHGRVRVLLWVLGNRTPVELDDLNLERL